MSLQARFKIDPEKAAKGVDVSYLGGEVVLRIRRAGNGNAEFRRVLAAKLEPHQRALKAGETLNEDLSQRLFAEAYAEAVVVGWKGVTDDDGNALPFTKENCVEVFTTMPDFFERVREDATDLRLFVAQQKESDAKN